MNGRRYASTGAGASLFILVLGVAFIGGWIANIVKLAGMTWTGNEVMVILRVAGIFTGPVGSVLGFI